MISLTYKTVLYLYLASSLVYITALVVERVMVAKCASWLLAGAAVIHGGLLVVRVSRLGWGGAAVGTGVFFFGAWMVVVLYLLFQMRTRTRVLGAIVSPVAFITMVAASVGVDGQAAVPAILKGSWLSCHVLLTVVGEAFFALACCAGVMYVLKDRQLRRRKIRGWSGVLPSLGELDRVNHVSLIGGFIFLTLGLLAGAVWARTVWGHHWQWDPKQVAALIVWVVYAFLVHQRTAFGWKGKRAAYSSVIAFVLMAGAFAGVMLWFESIHVFV